MAETSTRTPRPSKTIRRKRLQHYIRQMKELVEERIPLGDRNDKIGTIEALDRTVELLKTTPVYSGERANLSPAHSCSDTIENLAVHSSEDPWASFSNHFSRRHLFSARISLPDGKITQFKRNTNDTFQLEEERCGECFYDLLSDCGRHALLSNVYTHVQRKRILTRLNGEKRLACELICDFVRPPDGHLTAQVHAMQLPTAFSPSSTFTPLLFTTRHLSSCCLTHLDASAAPYIGHLPGEVIGRSILCLIHPYDMPQIKQMHSELIHQRGGMIRQHRLRWVAFNGSVVHTDSEWSAYWNPWSMKLDVIVGRHSVSEHPIGNADVLSEPTQQRIVTPLTEAAMRSIENDITAIINNQYALSASPQVQKHRNAPVAHQKHVESPETSSTTHLGNYIDSLVETLVIDAGNHPKYSMPCMETGRSTLTPTDLSSVNFSNSIPLSYNQINCLENVQRLLKSHPRTEADACSSPDKMWPSSESTSPLPVPEQDDLNKELVDVPPSMPLTREVLQQHTRKWEQEYKDSWKKRLSIKRSAQQNDLVVPVAAKLFRDASQKPIATQSAPGTFPCVRNVEYWTPSNKEEYYRKLAPNPPPPPGRNFQITSIPLSPPLPVSEHRSAFVSVSPTTGVINANSIREHPQPMNLSISEPIASAPSPSKLLCAAVTSSVPQPYRSVIRNTPARTPTPTQPSSTLEQSAVVSSTIPQVNNTFVRCAPSALATDWASAAAVGNKWPFKVGEWTTTERQVVDAKDNCAARLISLAHRAQQQQFQYQKRRILSPCPVKEATDALMLLQNAV